MKRKAFTLIEMIGTLALIMILITVSSIAIGKTLKTNKEKTLQLKIANLLQTTEDYVLKNKIKVADNVPLYFSVDGLIKDNIISDNVNEAIQEIMNIESEHYFVKVYKPDVKTNLDYKIITLNDFQNEIGVEVLSNIIANWDVAYLPDSTKIINEKENIIVNFKLVGNNDLLYNLYFTKAKYTLYSEELAKNVIVDEPINNIKVKDDGSYYFKINNNLNPGIYRLKLKLDTDFGNKIEATNDLTMVLNDNTAKPLVTYIENEPTAVWHNDNELTFNVYGEQLVTNKIADVIKYEGYRYNNMDDYNNKVKGTPINETYVNITTNKSITLSVSGIYDLIFTSEISASNSYTGKKIEGNAKQIVIKLDNIKPIVSITKTPSTGWASSFVLTCSVTETNSGVVYRRFNGLDQESITVTVSEPHNCVVRDLAGNEETAPYKVTNLETPPVVNLVLDHYEYAPNGMIKGWHLKCTAYDNETGINASDIWYFDQYHMYSNGVKTCSARNGVGIWGSAPLTVSGLDSVYPIIDEIQVVAGSGYTKIKIIAHDLGSDWLPGGTGVGYYCWDHGCSNGWTVSNEKTFYVTTDNVTFMASDYNGNSSFYSRSGIGSNLIKTDPYNKYRVVVN